MKLLVLGGTKFVGRHLVQAALDAGHDVSIFNRGITNPGLFPQVRHFVGDREDGRFDALKGHEWDGVIDTCGYLPRIVKQSAQVFSGSAALYVFISTISVYSPPKGTSLIDVRTPVYATATSESEYGPMKAMSEVEVRDVFPTRALIIRPGIIVGPHDPTDRFTYWVYKSGKEKRFIAPGNGTQPVQIIDARDLAHWIVKLVEKQATGFYNAVGPAVPVTMRRLLEACLDGTASSAEIVWLSQSELDKLSVDAEKFPLYLSGRDDWYMFSVDPARAISAGLTLRPLSATVRDTFNWIETLPASYQPGEGLTREVESPLLSLLGKQTLV
jgi:2'-hydroxyisoflavone reductase